MRRPLIIRIVHFMMEEFLKAIFVAALIVCTGFSVSARAADSVIGAWRLIAVTEEETANKVVHKPLGEHPLGLIIFTADGYMSFIMADPSRKAAAAPKATDAEAAALYRTMAAYSGKYRLDGDKLTNHPEIAWNQAWNGTDQRRTVAISGNTLRVTTAPFVSPFYDKEIVSVLVFERER
jgi:Lipocalin-like domain